MTRAMLAALVALPSAPVFLGAQPVTTLGPPLFTTGADFTDVSAARLFGDGSMLVADPGAREFVRVSARGAHRVVIGRHGAGPAEYESAQQLLAMPNAQSALVDPPQNRWMTYDSAGGYRGTRVFGPTERVLRYASFADARGNAYGLWFPSAPPARPERALLRWTAATGRIDTIATLAGPEMVGAALPAGGDGRPAGTAYFFVPFAAQDAWAVFTDGTFVIARAGGERLEWRDATGGLVHTTLLPALPRVPVSDSARRAESRVAVRDRMPRLQPLWAESTLHPMDGHTVWLRRSPHPDEPFTEFVEFTREGGAVRRLRVPGRVRLVGREGDRVVLARRTADELQALEVYPVPKRPGAALK